MKRRFLIGLAPLLAAAFAVMPVAAQAVGHYYSNGLKLPEGSKRVVTEWGTITAVGVRGGILPNHLTCHEAQAGIVENPTGAGAGLGTTEAIVGYQCEEENLCPSPTVPKITGERNANGWPSVVTEPAAGLFRVETSRFKLDLGCFNNLDEHVGGMHFVEMGGFGTETPGLRLTAETHNGTSAAHPASRISTAESGEIEAEGSGGTQTGRLEGELKVLGYVNQELISIKP